MFGKVFASELDGSIVEEAPHVRLLWHYLIILSDQDGNVDMTHEALARRVNLPLEQVRHAIERLSLPDLKSRTPDEEGRRIIPLDDHRDWGWRLVNYPKYRRLRDASERREYMREYQRERRKQGGNMSTPVNSVSTPVNSRKQCQPIAEAEEEVEAERGRGECEGGQIVGSRELEPTPQPKFLDEEREKNQELNWRLLQCWEVHLEARARFFAGENGYRPGRTPTLTKAIAKTVRTALLEHDAHLLRPDQRLEWVQTSAVRAAGIGLFMDPWCTGKANNNRVSIDEGARYFLESDRAWRPQRGKPDPIPRFAELYWSTKDAQEHHHHRELAAGATLQRALSDAGGLALPPGLALPKDEPN